MITKKDKIKSLSGHRTNVLLTALQDIFFVEGFRRITIAELSERLHCSKRTLYVLADSKEELFIKVLNRNLEEIWELGLQVEQEISDPITRIHQYVVVALTPTRKWSPAFLADVESLPVAKQLLNKHLEQRMKRLEQMVTAGIDKGVFRSVNPEVVAGLLYSSAAYFCSADFLESAELSLTEAIQQLCKLVWHGLVTSAEEDTIDKDIVSHGRNLA